MPEREALGLNVIEAQACGVPVMAPGAPPFTETVLPEQTGWLYADPRLGGKSNEYPPFAELLEHVITLWQRGELPGSPACGCTHAKFSRQQFRFSSWKVAGRYRLGQQSRIAVSTDEDKMIRKDGRTMRRLRKLRFALSSVTNGRKRRGFAAGCG